MKAIWFGVALVLMNPAAHAALAPGAKAEVTHLLDKVGNSDCKFNRNGSWHDARAARSHLQKKLDYLEKKNLISDAEGFITQGASESSSSGKAYQIACPGSPAVASGTWFREELKRYRQGK